MRISIEQRLNAEAEYPTSLYREHGYIDRADYLKNLAEEHDLTLQQLDVALAWLPPSEDFDGLVTALEDHADTLRS